MTWAHTSKLLGFFRGNCAQVSQIALVSDQHNDNVSISMISQLLQPSCDVLVGLVLADVVYEQRTDSAPVVGRGDGAVSLLTSSIPNLRLDGLGIDLDGPRSEFNTDRRLGVQVELVSGESTKQIGLSDARVSNQDHCKQKQKRSVSCFVKDAGRESQRHVEGDAPLKRNCDRHC